MATVDLEDSATSEENSPQQMADDDFEATVRAILEDSIAFIDREIAPTRALAGRYYRGEKFGNERDGRSQVVSRDCSDAVRWIMPSLMRIFFSPDKIVEFRPRSKEDIALAEQQTDTVRYAIEVENPGFMLFYEAFMNALINKTGVFKWRWNKDKTVSTATYTGIDHMQIQLLLEKQGSTLESMEPCEYLTPDQPLWDVEIKRIQNASTPCIEVLAPEEFLIDRKARTIKTADLVAHRTDLTSSELISMGFTQTEIDEATSSSDLALNIERIERDPSQSNFDQHGGAISEAMKRIPYVEAYCRIDYDGDGIAELRRVCCLGSNHTVARNDAVDEAPFSYLCPLPEPNVFFGTALTEILGDLQLIKSSIQRNMLDSLAQSIHNTPVITEGQVNMGDVLNQAVGRPVRERTTGSYRELVHTFVGKEAFPVLDYYDRVFEKRTGLTEGSQGLNEDALQSTTPGAVAAQQMAAMQRIELIARIFAETGIKDLFQGLLRLIVRNQDREKVIRLRNKWVPVDPRSWEAEMDVSINLALGAGTNSDRLNTLRGIAEKQELIMQTAGISNPIVSPRQYANTLRKMVELSGFVDPDQFFNEITIEQEKAIQQSAGQNSPQQNDPQMIVAQATVQQIQADMQKKQAELMLAKQKMFLEDDRARDKQAADERIAMAELAAKYHIDMTSIAADIKMEEDKPRPTQ